MPRRCKRATTIPTSLRRPGVIPHTATVHLLSWYPNGGCSIAPDTATPRAASRRFAMAIQQDRSRRPVALSDDFTCAAALLRTWIDHGPRGRRSVHVRPLVANSVFTGSRGRHRGRLPRALSPQSSIRPYETEDRIPRRQTPTASGCRVPMAPAALQCQWLHSRVYSIDTRPDGKDDGTIIRTMVHKLAYLHIAVARAVASRSALIGASTHHERCHVLSAGAKWS